MPHRTLPSNTSPPDPESPDGGSPELGPADVDLTDPLTGTLEHLSLETSSETRGVDPEPVGFNPFEVYLQQNTVEQQPQFIEHLVQDVIQPQIEGLRRCRRFELRDSHVLYDRARQFQERWGVSEASFSNFCQLLSGCLEFPSILLLNPSPLDHLPFDEMLEESTTLLWVQDVLQPMRLTIQDIIVFDTFPMVTDDSMDRLSEEDQRRFAQEAFDLTLCCFRSIQPQILISCQCSTQSSNYRWWFVDHTVARSLCSSVNNARAQRVRTVHVDTHPVHVVQGFHPSYVAKMLRCNAGMDLDSTLQGIFERVFRPYGQWKLGRDATERELQGSVTLVRAGLLHYLSQIKLHERICQRSAAFGIVGPSALESVQELQSQIDRWIERFST